MMFRTCAIACALITGTAIGCSFPDDEVPQLGNTSYPNNGAYGPDATVYYPDAGKDVDVFDASDASNDSATNICIKECAPLQCGTVPNQCGSFITCTPCRGGEECVDNFCRTKPTACVPETDISFCNRFNKHCGSHTGLDNCGVGRTVVECAGACAGVCFNNACCIPKTDAQLCTEANAQCGNITATDCGIVRAVACQPCVAPGTCIANKCEVPVVPDQGD